MFDKKNDFIGGEKNIKYTMLLSESKVALILEELIDFSFEMLFEKNNPYDYKMYSELLIMYYYTDLIGEKNIVEGFRGTHTKYLMKGYLQFLDADTIPKQAKDLMEMGEKIMNEIYFANIKQKSKNNAMIDDKAIMDFITNKENEVIIKALEGMQLK